MSQSPIKTDDKGKTPLKTVCNITSSASGKDQNISSDDLMKELDEPTEVTSLPKPDPMPVDDDGEIIDTRIPIIINPPKKSSTLDFLSIFSNLPVSTDVFHISRLNCVYLFKY
jgi:hypothetical protein